MSCSAEMAFFHPNFMLQTPHEDDHTHPSTSILPPSTPQDQFHGVASLLGKRSSMLFSSGMEEMNNNNSNTNINGDQDEFSDDGSQIGEKKRRLNLEQVKTLEKNFELGNKLEPERKMQLARSLGLQPRQVAIWFQNRRARWKTKQLEKDYDILKRQFDAVKAENDLLQSHNHKLQAQIMALKTTREPTESINLNKETEGSSSNRSENSSEFIKLDISRAPAIDSPDGPGLLPSSLNRPTAQNSSRPEINHGPKMDQGVKEESLSNMFCGMDDHTGFWPWLDQQNFN